MKKKYIKNLINLIKLPLLSLFIITLLNNNIALLSSEYDLEDFNTPLFDPGEPDDIAASKIQASGTCIDPELLLNLLDNFGILNILEQDLYCRTNPINVRSLLDLPALTPYTFYNDNPTFTFQPFYNQTRLCYYTKRSPYIDSYLALKDSSLTNLLSEALAQADEQLGVDTSNIDILKILGLFKDIKLEERRAGAMFGFFQQYCSISLSLFMPFYFLEHNFFLTDAEIDRIKNAPFFKQDGVTPERDENEAEAYFKTHLANDKIGFGDTRINLEAHILNAYKTDMWFGAQFTIPTAGSVHEGYLLGRFDDLACTPSFDIQALASCFTQENPQPFNSYLKESISFLEQTLDRLSTILLNTSLGNGGFLGIGPRFNMAHYLNPNWTIYTMLTYEFFTKKSQTRFFLTRKNKEEFDRDLTDDDKAEENLNFINEQIVNTFFPQRAFIDTRPGNIFKFRNAILFDDDHWNATFGIDLWYRKQEKLYPSPLQSSTLYIDRGTKSSCYQFKLYNTLGYFGVANDLHYHILTTVDGSIASSGIGEDFTVGIRLGLEF